MIVDRARSLVGCDFRPQGRSPALGLDCIGVILASCQIPSSQVRRDYRMRGEHLVSLRKELHPYFRRVSPKEMRPGDVLLSLVRHDQLHLAVFCGESFVHADAGLRKVVETPGMPPWRSKGVFRRRVPKPKRER